MKTIARIVFKIHRIIYKYPTVSEIRLILDPNYFIETNWYICMLYISGESISEIADLIHISEDMVKQRLNEAASTLNL